MFRSLLTLLLVGVMISIVNGGMFWSEADLNQATANGQRSVGAVHRDNGADEYGISSATPIAINYTLTVGHGPENTAEYYLRHGNGVDFRDTDESVAIIAHHRHPDYDPNAPFGQSTDLWIIEHEPWSSNVPIFEINRDTEMELMDVPFSLHSAGQPAYAPETFLSGDGLFREGSGMNTIAGGTGRLRNTRTDFIGSVFSNSSPWLGTDGDSGSCQIIDRKCAVVNVYNRGGFAPNGITVGIKVAEHAEWIDSIINPSPPRSKFDLDENDRIDGLDFDEYASQLRSGSDTISDLDENGVIDAEDLSFFISDGFGSVAGDANLDGTVNFPDFLTLSANFGSEAGWHEGDFDGTGHVAFPDFLALSANFGFVAESPEVAAIPEPSAAALLLTGLLGIAMARRACRGKFTAA